MNLLKWQLKEVHKAMKDIHVVQDAPCDKYIEEARKLVRGKNDQKIMAAVLYSKPDYLITGDKHFYNDKVKSKVKVRRTKEILATLKVV